MDILKLIVLTLMLLVTKVMGMEQTPLKDLKNKLEEIVKQMNAKDGSRCPFNEEIKIVRFYSVANLALQASESNIANTTVAELLEKASSLPKADLCGKNFACHPGKLHCVSCTVPAPYNKKDTNDRDKIYLINTFGNPSPPEEKSTTTASANTPSITTPSTPNPPEADSPTIAPGKGPGDNGTNPSGGAGAQSRAAINDDKISGEDRSVLLEQCWAKADFAKVVPFAGANSLGGSSITLFVIMLVINLLRPLFLAEYNY